METGTGIRNFLEYVVGSLVGDPDKVLVTCSTDEGKLLFSISLGDADTESVAGTSGKTMGAIRSLAQASARVHNLRAFVQLEGEERYKPKFRDDHRGPGGGRDRDRRGGGRDRRGGRPRR